jgi:hypothetical protein
MLESTPPTSPQLGRGGQGSRDCHLKAGVNGRLAIVKFWQAQKKAQPATPAFFAAPSGALSPAEGGFILTVRHSFPQGESQDNL